MQSERARPHHGGRVAALLAASLALLASSALPASAHSKRSITSEPRVLPSPLDAMTPDGRPTPEGLEMLRSHVRGRQVRLRLRDRVFIVRRVHIDSLGVTFAEPREERQRGNAGGAADKMPGRIPWTALDGLETRHSNVLAGAGVGALFMAAVAVVMLGAAGSDPGPGIAIFVVFPPAGALIGAPVGAMFPHWRHEWPPAR